MLGLSAERITVCGPREAKPQGIFCIFVIISCYYWLASHHRLLSTTYRMSASLCLCIVAYGSCCCHSDSFHVWNRTLARSMDAWGGYFRQRQISPSSRKSLPEIEDDKAHKRYGCRVITWDLQTCPCICTCIMSGYAAVSSPAATYSSMHDLHVPPTRPGGVQSDKDEP
jgi:hypothetical protein